MITQATIATPISTIFDNSMHVREILELSDTLEFRDFSKAVPGRAVGLFHCEASLVEPWSDSELQEIVKIIEDNRPRLVTFHLKACYEKPEIKDGIFITTGRQMSHQEMLGNAENNLKNLSSKLHPVPAFGVENNNYYPTGAYEIVTDAEFINELMARFDLNLLLDVAHAQITAINQKIKLDDYLHALNLNRTIQLHLSRPDKNSTPARDVHEALEDEDWALVKMIIKSCPNLRYITLEYYKDDQKLIGMLKTLRRLIS